MLKTYLNPEKKSWPELFRRPVLDVTELFGQVRDILSAIQSSGDAALRSYTKQFDHAEIERLQVTPEEIAHAVIPSGLKEAITTAYNNITRFHEAQQSAELRIETSPGVVCWRKSVPIEKVGLYIPGGTAPLFSTVLMLAVPAKLAGCTEIVLCTPPDTEGKIHPAILFAASLAGTTKIIKAGGAQAIAAMAYGTESVPKVDKIFGPGNQYVTAAKQLVSLSGTAIDMPAGPSEVAVIADHSARPEFVAADLLSQAEHGKDSQVVLFTTDQNLNDAVLLEVTRQLENLPRKDFALPSLSNSKSFVVPDMETAVEMSNAYAPEHLIIATENARQVADKIINAGSVFVGHFTPESAGDYASGTNHTLPTNGSARAYSGVSLDSFIKKITFQEISEEGIEQLGDTIETMAEAELLQAHSNAVKIRRNTP